MDKERQRREDQVEITRCFKQKCKDSETIASYDIYGFVVSKDKGFSNVSAHVERNGIRSMWRVKGTEKARFLELSSSEKYLKDAGFVINNRENNITGYYLRSKEPIGLLQTTNGHLYPIVRRLIFYSPKESTNSLLYNQEDVKNLNNVCMRSIKRKITVSKCRRLEQLQEGLELVVCGIKSIDYRKRARYILEIENFADLYISNYWLEKVIIDSKIDLNSTFNIKLGKLEITPTRKKERDVFCV